MIRLIHGSDTAASRKKLQDTVNNINGETVYFNGNNLTLSELLLALSFPPLKPSSSKISLKE